MCSSDLNLGGGLRDNANDTMFQIVMDVNNTSAHGVQDDVEGYNKVLIQLCFRAGRRSDMQYSVPQI